MGRLVRADDHSVAIVGTLELVPGCAAIRSATKVDGYEFDLEYGGHTQMYWNDQTTQRSTLNGKRLFVDEGGEVVDESQIHLIED